MSAPLLVLYIWLFITVPSFLAGSFIFSEAFINWRTQVNKGSNGARHRVAENSVVVAGALISALLFMVVLGVLAYFPPSLEHREGVQIGFRLYGVVTALVILVATLRSVSLIKEIVIILDNVASDEGLDLPSLHPPTAKATIDSMPIKRPEGDMPIVTAPVAVVLPGIKEVVSGADMLPADMPIVTAPVIVMMPPKDSVMDRKNK